MASPFENLLQAAQFAVQTRANYDQMAERRRENTMNLMQRRSEMEQQKQQFLTEVNLKDRQMKMQAEQFDATTAMQYAFERNRDARAGQLYELQKRQAEFQMGPQFEAEQAYRREQIRLQGIGVSLAAQEAADRREERRRLLAAEAEAKKPISLGEAPGLFTSDTSLIARAPRQGLLGNALGKIAFGVGERFRDIGKLSFEEYAKKHLNPDTKKGARELGQEAADIAEAQFPAKLLEAQRGVEELEKMINQSLSSGRKVDPIEFSKTITGLDRTIQNLGSQARSRNSGEYRQLFDRYSIISTYLNSGLQQTPQQ